MARKVKLSAPTSLEFFSRLVWFDGRPLMDTIEPYNRANRPSRKTESDWCEGLVMMRTTLSKPYYTLNILNHINTPTLHQGTISARRNWRLTIKQPAEIAVSRTAQMQHGPNPSMQHQ